MNESAPRQEVLVLFWCFLLLLLPISIPVYEIKDNFVLPFWQFVFKMLGFSNVRLHSDSQGQFGIVFIGLIFFLLSLLFYKKGVRRFALKFEDYARYFLIGFLFCTFVKYGVDKLMLLQFPEPEPNVMRTNLGLLEKDILFWTTVGSSKLFSILTGTVELLGALFLLFRRTRKAGYLLLLVCVFQILLVNFSFNIGVKLLPLILLGILITLNWSTLKFLFLVVFGFKEDVTRSMKKQWIRNGFKLSLAGLILVLVYRQNKENEIPRKWIGTYFVKNQIDNGNKKSNLKTIYINQQNFWIEECIGGEREVFQLQEMGLETLTLKNLKGKKRWIQIKSKNRNQYTFSDLTNHLSIEVVKEKRVNLPVLRDEFSWVAR